jgi:hypothetical protein
VLACVVSTVGHQGFHLCGAHCDSRLGFLVSACANQVDAVDRPDGPYKVVNSATVGGEGGFDHGLADSDGRRPYVPRSGGSKSVLTYWTVLGKEAENFEAEC